MSISTFTLADLLKIQVVIGIVATLISYPFIAAYWLIRNGVEGFSLSGIFFELFSVAFWACGTGLGMAVMALVAYPVLKLLCLKGCLT